MAACSLSPHTAHAYRSSNLFLYEVRNHCFSLTTPGNGGIQQCAANQRSGHWLTHSHAARPDTVEDGVVPVSVEPCDFGVRRNAEGSSEGYGRLGLSLQPQ